MAHKRSLKRKIWEVIFEAETPSGKFYDLALMVTIIMSVLVVMLESVDHVAEQYQEIFTPLEWVFTILFSLDYLCRLWVIKKPLKYALSFFGMVDLLSCLPTYLMIFFPGAQSLLVIRVLRLLRVFRVLRMVRHVNGAELILKALHKSRAKVLVFFFAVFLFNVVAGTLLYVAEGHLEDSLFTNIPISIYWSIVTVSTVGYGDITPVTGLGRFLTSICILIGYAIIAVPTGIVTADIIKTDGDDTSDACPGCGVHGHLDDAVYCRRCGEEID